MSSNSSRRASEKSNGPSGSPCCTLAEDLIIYKLCPQHLLDTIVGTCTPAAQECPDRLTQWINVAVSGKMDCRIAPFMTGASLTALCKKGGQGVRLIAVGEIL